MVTTRKMGKSLLIQKNNILEEKVKILLETLTRGKREKERPFGQRNPFGTGEVVPSEIMLRSYSNWGKRNPTRKCGQRRRQLGVRKDLDGIDTQTNEQSMVGCWGVNPQRDEKDTDAGDVLFSGSNGNKVKKKKPTIHCGVGG